MAERGNEKKPFVAWHRAGAALPRSVRVVTNPMACRDDPEWRVVLPITHYSVPSSQSSLPLITFLRHPGHAKALLPAS